jgi:hypothetical protein
MEGQYILINSAILMAIDFEVITGFPTIRYFDPNPINFKRTIISFNYYSLAININSVEVKIDSRVIAY